MLSGKNIIVTGGSGLIGKAILKDLLEKKAKVLNFDINGSNIAGVKEVYCDITKPGSIDLALSKIIELETIDGLVNNAYPRTADWGLSFQEISYLSWQQNIDMQLNSIFYMTQKILQKMEAQNSGSIVNMASIYGVVGNDFTIYEQTDMNPPAAYPAIKGGIISFTRYLASLYGKYNVRINCISPGGIFDHQPKEFVQKYSEKVPLGRMGIPEDIAAPTSFLLSDDAKYITGQNLVVDGGWTII